jgi:EmrB/QacA subfamily drug resistance transporter
MIKINEKKLIPLCVALAMLMETLDATIVSTAIPQIAQHLNISPILLKFALTSYLVSLSIFIPISGWLADKFGTRIIFSSAIGIFTIGSVWCGIAESLIMLVIGRTFQGVGGAMMMPVGRLMILKTFPKEDLIMTNNYVSIPGLIGPALGPLLGGIITTYLSWRWIFFVNIPFGIIGIYLTHKYFTNHKNLEINKLDSIGFVLLGAGMAGLALWFQFIGENIVTFKMQTIIITLTATILVLYIWHAIYTSAPLINLSLFKINTFRITIIGSLLSRIGLGGIPFLLPLLFQTNFNLSPLHSGLLILPMALGMMSMKFFVKLLLENFGFKFALMINTILIGLSIMQLGLITQQTPTIFIILSVFINGVVSSLQFSSLNTLTYADLDNNQMSQGTSIASTIQQFSKGIGVAFAALILHHYIPTQIKFVTTTAAFQKTFFIVGITTIMSSIVFYKLNKNDGQNVSGYHKDNKSPN